VVGAHGEGEGGVFNGERQGGGGAGHVIDVAGCSGRGILETRIDRVREKWMDWEQEAVQNARVQAQCNSGLISWSRLIDSLVASIKLQGPLARSDYSVAAVIFIGTVAACRQIGDLSLGQDGRAR